MNARWVFPLPVIALVLLVPAHALAQAWKPPKGEFSFAISYQFLDADRHLFSSSVVGGVDRGSRSLDIGTIQSQVLVLDGDIGVTDRLAVNAAVAFVNGRYVEGGTHGPADDGDWHGAFQDARISARFMAFNNGSWVLTPGVSYGFPTTNYVTRGHAALGRKLNELRLGLYWGKLLSFSGAPKAYLQGDYSYAFMENPADDIPIDRSNLLVEFGYFLGDFLTLQVWTDYQNIHGGLDWGNDADRSHNNFQMEHDRTAASDFWRLGGGVSVPVNDSVELYANVAKTLWGINTHNGLTVSLGMSWGFQAFGRGGLGVWEQGRDDPNADLDDWLLQGLEDEGD